MVNFNFYPQMDPFQYRFIALLKNVMYVGLFFNFQCFKYVSVKLKKTCIWKISVNTNNVNFGTIVICEQSNRKIQLINKGALGTKFQVLQLNQVKSDDNTKSTTESEGIRLGNVTLLKLYKMKCRIFSKEENIF